MRGRKTPLVITLTPQQKDQLESLLRRTTINAGLAQRVRIILLLAEGHSITATAQSVGDQRRIVRKWGKRFVENGLEGLEDAPRSGRPPVFSPLRGAAHRQDRLRTSG